jgi:hypothetical protein
MAGGHSQHARLDSAIALSQDPNFENGPHPRALSYTSSVTLNLLNDLCSLLSYSPLQGLE